MVMVTANTGGLSSRESRADANREVSIHHGQYYPGLSGSNKMLCTLQRVLAREELPALADFVGRLHAGTRTAQQNHNRNHNSFRHRCPAGRNDATSM
jgi:hypothetical protein